MDFLTFEKIKTYKEADQHSWTKQELQDYDKIFIREQDDRGKFTLIEKKGIEKGKIEGKIEEQIKFVINADKMGLSIENIIKLTGLTKEEIENILKL